MSIENMGMFISELRKSHQMTQKELAIKLNVSDKAVSKWERGLSCPDISLLSPLSDVFGVTTTELLNGTRTGSESVDVEVLVVNALEYGEKTVKRKIELNQSIIAAAFSVLLLIGIFVVFIVDFATSGTLSWSLIPISASVLAWFVFFPVLKFGAKGIVGSLIAVSVFIVPFLYVIDRLIKTNVMIFPMGIRIAPLAIAFFWIAYLLFKKLRTRILLAIAILMLLLSPLNYFTNSMIASMLNRPYDGVDVVLNTFPTVIVAAILFIVESVVQKRKRNKS